MGMGDRSSLGRGGDNPWMGGGPPPIVDNPVVLKMKYNLDLIHIDEVMKQKSRMSRKKKEKRKKERKKKKKKERKKSK